MKISVFSPVKNEVDFIGYSVMAVLPYVHEILYGVAKSDDGTEELLRHIQTKYGQKKLRLFSGWDKSEPKWDFDPLDMKAYNDSYNYLIDQATGDAIWFLHPDMIVTNPEALTDVKEGPLAWYTHITSFARDLNTKITKGRTDKWKNIHVKDFGAHYYGGYGSKNEDIYFREITGDSYEFYGADFEAAPYEIADSGIRANHYCELKDFTRRLEKMKRCLKTQMPGLPDDQVDAMARAHPRVTLEPGNTPFGDFRFEKVPVEIPSVFKKYGAEFGAFKKELVSA